MSRIRSMEQADGGSWMKQNKKARDKYSASFYNRQLLPISKRKEDGKPVFANRTDIDAKDQGSSAGVPGDVVEMDQGG